VNLRAPFALLQAAVPMLRLGAKAFPETGAKVIALASITGVYAEQGLSVYGATKAALISLVETFNVEESHHGVAATALAPGYVDTDMTAWARETISSDQMIRVDDVVELVDALLRMSAMSVVPKIVITRSGDAAYQA
jgi:NAD(P)-dependent dehydrogenase (short-subunit alcohol dehydrogenase family)